MSDCRDYTKYKYDIFEALIQIREVEGFPVGIDIPYPPFEFYRYTNYPYSKPFRNVYNSDDDIEDLFEKRIRPYLSDIYDIKKGDFVG